MPKVARTVPEKHALRLSELVRIGIKFGLVGVFGVVVNTASLAVLYRGAHLPLYVASLLAVELSIVTNYLFNDRWTFARKHLSWRRFGKFNIATAGALVVTPTVLWFLVELRMHFLAANLIAIGVGAALNFILSVLWVWRQPGGGVAAWSPSSSPGLPPSR